MSKQRDFRRDFRLDDLDILEECGWCVWGMCERKGTNWRLSESQKRKIDAMYKNGTKLSISQCAMQKIKSHLQEFPDHMFLLDMNKEIFIQWCLHDIHRIKICLVDFPDSIAFYDRLLGKYPQVLLLYGLSIAKGLENIIEDIDWLTDNYLTKRNAWKMYCCMCDFQEIVQWHLNRFKPELLGVLSGW